MTVYEGLRGLLLDSMPVSALVSQRVSALRLKEKPILPAIVLTQISAPRLGSHLRGSGALFSARVQLDCWAATPDDASALGSLSRLAIDGFTGVWTNADSPEETIVVSLIEQLDERDLFEEDIHGGICRHSADYQIDYQQTGEIMLTP